MLIGIFPLVVQRPRYLNAKTTLHTLLNTYHTIPIVNENDTVSVSELRFGDNDTLSAITAGLVDADYLFLCTDVDGLYTGNPRTNPNARRLGVVASVQEARKAVSVDTPGSSFGTGGMQTKLIAAELATAAGVATVIISSDQTSHISDIVSRGLPRSNEIDDPMTTSISSLTSEEASLIGHPPLSDPAHTLFLPQASPLPSRKWSVLHALHPTGAIIIDEGAWKRIQKHDSGGRLLPAGIVAIKGHWERMQAVRLVVRLGARAVAPTAASSSSGLVDKLKEKLDLTGSNETSSSSTSATASGSSTPPALVDALKPAPTSAAPRVAADTLPEPTPAATTPSPRDVEVGRCLANYTSEEVEMIKGHKSSEIERLLGYADSEYVTDTVVMLDREAES